MCCFTSQCAEFDVVRNGWFTRNSGRALGLDKICVTVVGTSFPMDGLSEWPADDVSRFVDDGIPISSRNINQKGPDHFQEFRVR